MKKTLAIFVLLLACVPLVQVWAQGGTPAKPTSVKGESSKSPGVTLSKQSSKTGKHGAIPYIYVPTFKIFGKIPIQPFGVLVGIGLVLGYVLTRRRARLTGLDPDLIADGMMWTVGAGFVIGHLVSVVFYFPHRIVENPLVLIYIWSGLSSFGGFIGGILGLIYFFRKRGLSILEHADAGIFGMLPGWLFGRMGCATVHDHPGKVTDFFLGVHCAEAPCFQPWVVGQTRHDLGLYELILTVFLTILLYSLRNVRPFRGFHPALILIIYSPIRFMFDYLRTADKHYFGLTPGQYFAVGMLLFGVGLMAYGMRLRKRGIIPGKVPAGVPIREVEAYLAEKAKEGS